MMNWYYISYANHDGFKGATLVEGFHPEHALEIAANNGLDPGGCEARVTEVPDQIIDDPRGKAMMYKLFNEAMMEEAGCKRHADLDEAQQARLIEASTTYQRQQR